MFLLMMAMIFVVEAGVMLVLPLFATLTSHPVVLLLIDAGLLVAVLCPGLWLLIVRPVRGLAHERGELLREQTSIAERERTRLARELHDELGQVQTAILLTAKAAADSGDFLVMRERVKTVHELASSAIESTRRLARGLSPEVLGQFGLGTAISRLTEDCRASGTIQIEHHDSLGGVRFDPDLELCVYRVIQEATVNALKHAEAQRIKVSVSLADGGLTFEVSDDGRGFEPWPERNPEGPGMGLRSMRERVELLGGTLVVEPCRGGGTRVLGRLPAEATNHE